MGSGLCVCSLRRGLGWRNTSVVMIYRQGSQATALNEQKKSRAGVLACVHQGKRREGSPKEDQEEATGRGRKKTEMALGGEG